MFEISQELKEKNGFVYTVIVMFCIGCLISVLGNIFTVFVYGFSKTSKKMSSSSSDSTSYTSAKPAFFYMLVSMGICDLLIGGLLVPMSIVSLFFPENSTNLCPFLRAIWAVFLINSNWSKFGIAVERYIIFLQPMKAISEGNGCLTKKRRCLLYLSIVWLIGGVFAILEFTRSDLEIYKTACVISWSENITQASVWLSATTVMPLVLMTIIYLIIIVRMYQKKCPGIENKNWTEKHYKAKKKTIITLFKTVVWGGCLWLPNSLLHFLVLVNPQFNDLIIQLIVLFALLLSTLANIIIYTCWEKKFQAELKKVLFFLPLGEVGGQSSVSNRVSTTIQ